MQVAQILQVLAISSDVSGSPQNDLYAMFEKVRSHGFVQENPKNCPIYRYVFVFVQDCMGFVLNELLSSYNPNKPLPNPRVSQSQAIDRIAMHMTMTELRHLVRSLKVTSRALEIKYRWKQLLDLLFSRS